MYLKTAILGEWLLCPLKLIESQAKTASAVFYSEFDVPGWHEKLYGPTLADAIVIRIDGDTMRKRKGIPTE